jgi:HlyD family secretion protein
MNQAKREHDRNKLLFEQKVIAQADYDLSLSTYETAVANARSSKAALNRAKINLKYATIYAPISGVVVSRSVDVGQTVAASFNTPTLFTIANDLTKMQVQASVDEADIGKVQVGQDVSFTVDAYDNMSFTGTVSQIRLQPTVTQNVVNYTVIIDVPNPDMKLLPGMTANCTINIQEVKDVLKVPASALIFSPPQEYIQKMMENLPDSIKQKREKWMGGQAGRRTGGQADRRTSGQADGRTGGQADGRTGRGGRGNSGMIWIKKGDTLTPRRVRLGLSDGSYTEVTGKIEEGDEVVTGQINKQQTTKTNTQQNPFAPQMQGRPGGR